MFAGLLAIVDGALILAGSQIMGFQLLGIITTPCAVLKLAFGVAAILGGVLATRGSRWNLAVFGAFLGMIAFGLSFIGPLMGGLATLIIAISRNDFESGQTFLTPRMKS